MVSVTAPWFLRGGYQNDNANAGVFTFSWWYGNSSNNMSFRQVSDYK